MATASSGFMAWLGALPDMRSIIWGTMGMRVDPPINSTVSIWLQFVLASLITDSTSILVRSRRWPVICSNCSRASSTVNRFPDALMLILADGREDSVFLAASARWRSKEVDSVLSFEGIIDVEHYLVIEVIAAQHVIAVGSDYRNLAPADVHDSHVERAASQVIHHYPLIGRIGKPVSQGRRCGLIDYAQHVKAGYLAGVYRGAPPSQEVPGPRRRPFPCRAVRFFFGSVDHRSRWRRVARA